MRGRRALQLPMPIGPGKRDAALHFHWNRVFGVWNLRMRWAALFLVRNPGAVHLYTQIPSFPLELFTTKSLWQTFVNGQGRPGTSTHLPSFSLSQITWDGETYESYEVREGRGQGRPGGSTRECGYFPDAATWDTWDSGRYRVRAPQCSAWRDCSYLHHLRYLRELRAPKCLRLAFPSTIKVFGHPTHRPIANK